jgi:hypothetical protein
MFRLALQMGRTVRELSDSLGADELVEWMAFYRIDPWGGYRTDLGAAMVASTLANVHRAPDSAAFTPDDFIVHEQCPEPVISVDHDFITAGCRSLFAAMRGAQ